MEKLFVKKMAVGILVVLSLSCTDMYDKSNSRGAYHVVNGVYAEGYKVSSGGALASDTYSSYLTDSINFRKCIGWTNDHTRIIELVIDSNHILVVKVYDGLEGVDTISRKTYCIPLLREEGKWD